MVNSRVALRDERTVSVGLSSTVIAGANGKRFRLTIYPTGTNAVWVSSTGPAVANSGMALIQGQPPVVLGGDGEGEAFSQSVQAITTGAPANVVVVDEFFA